MQDIDRRFEADGVDGPEGVAVMARNDFQDTGAEPLERFGVAMPKTRLGLVDREAHPVLHAVREPLQIRPARSYPFDRFQHVVAVSEI